MAQLIFSLPAEKTLVVPLETGVVTLGRSPENTVQIDEPSVSRRHARLACAPGSVHEEWTVEDLGSVNGVRHNGVRVTAAVTLRHGDTLTLGSISAFYRAAGSAPDDGAPDDTRTLAGIYRLETFLGGGPGCKSYRARDLAQQRVVSIKLIRAAAPLAAETFADLERAVERILQASHPNMVAPLRLGRDGEEIFLASEWIAGPPLLDLLRRQHTLAVRDALRLLAQVADALDHARAHGLPELDAAPGAIVLAPVGGGEPDPAILDKLLDGWPPFVLKLAPLLLEPRAENEFFDADPATVINPATVAGGTYLRRGAVFTLGTLVCEMLGHPLTGDFTAGLAFRPPRITGLGEAGNAVLRQGFAPDAGFASGREFCASLAAAVGVALEN